MATVAMVMWLLANRVEQLIVEHDVNLVVLLFVFISIVVVVVVVVVVVAIILVQHKQLDMKKAL